MGEELPFERRGVSKFSGRGCGKVSIPGRVNRVCKLCIKLKNGQRNVRNKNSSNPVTQKKQLKRNLQRWSWGRGGDLWSNTCVRSRLHGTQKFFHVFVFGGTSAPEAREAE